MTGAVGSGPVVRIAPAKLNLTLSVVGRRSDGYHDLHSVVVPLRLADVLTLAPAAGGMDSLHVVGRDAGPVRDNLVLRALDEARRAVGPAVAPPLAVRLDKRIPVAAGLGGGSSDAAATLDGAFTAWSAEIDDRRRAEIAARLGADVPLFLVGGAVLIEGRGERVTRLRGTIGDGEPAGILLVTPAVAVPTEAVYRAFADGARPPDPGASRAASVHLAAEMERGLSARALVDRAAVLASTNDLAAATQAIVPGLRDVRPALIRLLGRPVGQSGSGPTLWALYPSWNAADAAAEDVRAAISDGRLPLAGDGPPTVIATALGSAV
ncbi:MAG: 4-(cytidine 5'-diphospho)-2-C-methyl-D-erythritol kinase [Candidatus Limnocylindrales bacterium]